MKLLLQMPTSVRFFLVVDVETDMDVGVLAGVNVEAVAVPRT